MQNNTGQSAQKWIHVKPIYCLETEGTTSEDTLSQVSHNTQSERETSIWKIQYILFIIYLTFSKNRRNSIHRYLEKSNQHVSIFMGDDKLH